MKTTFVLWNDEAEHQTIRYCAQYEIAGDLLHVLDIVALELTEIDPISDTIDFKTPVQTESDRMTLRDRFIDAGMLQKLVESIASKHDLTIVSTQN